MTLTLHKAKGQLQPTETFKNVFRFQAQQQVTIISSLKVVHNMLRSFCPTKISAGCDPVPE